MTTAERLRFLADRMEDGKEFTCNGVVYRRSKNACMFANSKTNVSVDLSNLTYYDLGFQPILPELSADDIAFLKLAKDCGYGDWWIARDGIIADIWVHKKKPKKDGAEWLNDVDYEKMIIHSQLLNIKWEDDDCYTVNQLLGEKE